MLFSFSAQQHVIAQSRVFLNTHSLNRFKWV